MLRVIVLVLIALGIALSIVPNLFQVGTSTGELPPPNKTELKDIETQMELKLPPTTRPLSWSYDSWMESQLLLKIEIAPSDLQFLINNSPFANVPLRQNADMFYLDGSEWWDQGLRAKNVLFGETGLPQGQQYQTKLLQILVDMDRKDVHVVYLLVASI